MSRKLVAALLQLTGAAAFILPTSVTRPPYHHTTSRISASAGEADLRLPLSALSVGLAAAAELGTPWVPAAAPELESRKALLTEQLGDYEAEGLVFLADGSPKPETLALVLVLTARRADELEYSHWNELVAASESGAHPNLAARASCILSTVVSEALAEMEADEQNGAQPESMEDARSLHMRWAILELARARYAEDRPADWGSVGK